jgi:hypothetical protein
MGSGAPRPPDTKPLASPTAVYAHIVPPNAGQGQVLVQLRSLLEIRNLLPLPLHVRLSPDAETGNVKKL